MFCFTTQCNQNKTFEKPGTRRRTRLWMTRNNGLMCANVWKLLFRNQFMFTFQVVVTVLTVFLVVGGMGTSLTTKSWYPVPVLLITAIQLTGQVVQALEILLQKVKVAKSQKVFSILSYNGITQRSSWVKPIQSLIQHLLRGFECVEILGFIGMD